MKLIKAILRPERSVEVKDKLQELGFHGITTWKINGYGEIKKVSKRVYRGHVYHERMENVERTILELVVSDEKADEVVDTIKITGRTDEGGDGRIYTSKLEDSVHIDSGSQHVGEIAKEGGEGDEGAEDV